MFYGDDSCESLDEKVLPVPESIQAVPKSQEIEISRSSSIPTIVEPAKMSGLDLEINDLLAESSPDVLDQYKTMEIAIRDTYDEILKLDLPDIDPALIPRNSCPTSLIIGGQSVKQTNKKSKEPNIKSAIGLRNRYIRKHGVALTSELYIQKDRKTPNEHYHADLDPSSIDRIMSKSSVDKSDLAYYTVPDPFPALSRPTNAWRSESKVLKEHYAKAIPLPKFDTPAPEKSQLEPIPHAASSPKKKSKKKKKSKGLKSK